MRHPHAPRSGITEPVPRPLERLLRDAVLEHIEAGDERGRSPVLHAGVPGRRSRTYTLEAGQELDPALRVDIVEALVRPGVEAGRVPLLWITRPDEAGEGEDGEAQVDRDWLAAVGTAGAELGVRLDLVVITRRGWRDPRTGVHRRWRRLRRRS